MAMIDNGGLSPLGDCCLWGINKYDQESACDCNMVVTDEGFLLVTVDRLHWIFRGRIGNKKVWPIRGNLRYLLGINLPSCWVVSPVMTSQYLGMGLSISLQMCILVAVSSTALRPWLISGVSSSFRYILNVGVDV